MREWRAWSQAPGPFQCARATLFSALGYRQLVLATGAHPIRIPLQGDAATPVRSINTLDDFAGFHAALGVDATVPGSGEGKTVVVVMGAGLIRAARLPTTLHSPRGTGCTWRTQLRAHRLHCCPRKLTSEQLQVALSGLGVQWHFGTSVAYVNTDTRGKLLATLADGGAAQADLVLERYIDCVPIPLLALAAGLACERGVLVNTSLGNVRRGYLRPGATVPSTKALVNAPRPYVMPVMTAARRTGPPHWQARPPNWCFPLMPVSIETPALPIVVAAAHPAPAGRSGG